MQTPVVCPSGALNCFTLELSSNAGVTNFSRGCFPDMFCNQDFLCFAFNATAGFSLVSCAVQCCNTSECNAGVLPTTPSPPSTAATTMAPTTQTTAPTTPTTPAGKVNDFCLMLDVTDILVVNVPFPTPPPP